MKLNIVQEWYIMRGLNFSLIWVILFVFVSLFEATKQFRGIVIISWVAMIIITLVHIFIFADTKKNEQKR